MLNFNSMFGGDDGGADKPGSLGVSPPDSGEGGPKRGRSAPRWERRGSASFTPRCKGGGGLVFGRPYYCRTNPETLNFLVLIQIR